MARFDGAFWESFEAIRPQNAVPFSRMRSEGFPFNCGGLGAGGVFTRCFGPRSREDSMAGPLGKGAEGGPVGGEEEGRGAEGGPGGERGGVGVATAFGFADCPVFMATALGFQQDMGPAPAARVKVN